MVALLKVIFILFVNFPPSSQIEKRGIYYFYNQNPINFIFKSNN